MLERLDVNVAGAPPHGVGQQAVDQLDHRRVVDLRLGDSLVLLLLDDLDVLAPTLHVLEDALELLVGGLVVLLDQVAKGVLAGDDRKEIETGDELEVFEQAEIGGIGHGDGEGAPLPLERQHDALGGHFGGHQLDDLRIDLEPGEIDRGHAILAGQDLGDLQLLNKPELHQDVAQPVLAVLLLRQRLRELLARDEAFTEEDFAEPITTGCCRRHVSEVSEGKGFRDIIGSRCR